MRGQLLVEQPERVRERLRRRATSQPAVAQRRRRGGRRARRGRRGPARRSAPSRPPGRPRRRGRRGGGRSARGPGRARAARWQEARGALGEERAQPLPLVGGQVVAGLRREGGVVGVGDRVEVGRLEAGLGQAPAPSPARAAPRCENGTGALPCLRREKRSSSAAATIDAVDHEGGGRIVEDGVDSEYAHGSGLSFRRGSEDGDAARHARGEALLGTSRQPTDDLAHRRSTSNRRGVTEGPVSGVLRGFFDASSGARHEAGGGVRRRRAGPCPGGMSKRPRRARPAGSAGRWSGPGRGRPPGRRARDPRALRRAGTCGEARG